MHNDKVWSVVHTALPDLGIKYDASHCIGRGGDYLKELRDWGDRVYHVHLKGFVYIDGEGYDDAPAGLDQITWGPLFDVLYTKDYDGMFSIEPHSNYWKGEKGEWRKFKGLLVSVDDETFSVDIPEKVAVEGKKRKETQIVTHTWRYDEPKYVKYDLKF